MRSKVAGGTGFAGTNTLVCLANLVVAKLYTKDTPLKTYQFLDTLHPSCYDVISFVQNVEKFRPLFLTSVLIFLNRGRIYRKLQLLMHVLNHNYDDKCSYFKKGQFHKFTNTYVPYVCRL